MEKGGGKVHTVLSIHFGHCILILYCIMALCVNTKEHMQAQVERLGKNSTTKNFYVHGMGVS
jgi:hypothetical protein